MCKAKLHGTHTIFDWSTHSHNTGLIQKESRNNIHVSLKYSHMSWQEGGGGIMWGWGWTRNNISLKVWCEINLHLVTNITLLYDKCITVNFLYVFFSTVYLTLIHYCHTFFYNFILLWRVSVKTRIKMKWLAYKTCYCLHTRLLKKSVFVPLQKMKWSTLNTIPMNSKQFLISFYLWNMQMPQTVKVPHTVLLPLSTPLPPQATNSEGFHTALLSLSTPLPSPGHEQWRFPYCTTFLVSPPPTPPPPPSRPQTVKVPHTTLLSLSTPFLLPRPWTYNEVSLTCASSSYAFGQR